MKVKLFSLIFALLIGFSSVAQRPNMEKLRAVKVGMITEKLALTESQAKSFWPVYNKFDAERHELKRALRAKMGYSRSKETSEEDELERQDEIFELKEKELELSRKYRPAFLKVISAKQYSDLDVAEREFNQMLLRELRERRNTRDN
jgi:Skp family chaperone for outer membrane proteins